MFLFPRAICLMPVLAAALSLLAAAAPSPAPAPAQRLPLVIVTKADGTTARGQFVSADPDHVVVRAIDNAEPVQIPWSSIRRMSNGLTQPQAWAAWKEQHKDRLCDTCDGDRATNCPSCHGTDVDQSKLTPCDACEGSGVGDVCAAPRCNGTGKIDCPKPCLKLTQGTWKLRDGKRWRDFPTAGGTYSISESHLGELIDLRKGGSHGKCPTCDGTTKVDCPTCNGLGVAVCDRCDFAGATGPACPKCNAGHVSCTACAGTGLKK